MKLSSYIKQLETKYQTLVGLDGERLCVVSNDALPRFVSFALAGYAPQLIRYFKSGEDRDLSVLLGERELKSLGLMRIGGAGVWTHPQGDEVADQIIAGFIDHDDAQRDATTRNRHLSQFVRSMVRSGIEVPAS